MKSPQRTRSLCVCVCVCVSFETTHNVPFFFLNDEPRPDLPNWSRNCGVVAGRDRRTEELLSTPTAPWSTWPAPDCCKRRRCSWRTGRRTGWRSTPSGWCRSASCWASRCPSSEISGTPLISGEKKLRYSLINWTITATSWKQMTKA